jgi:peptidyl-tRNA hydrolase, PTH1 family
VSFFRRARGDDDERWIVFGLGNPGARYARTRHNAGVMVVDELLDRSTASLKRHKSGSLTAETTLGDGRAVLARAATAYMNESGRPLRELASFYKVAPQRIVVVHDELDIPFGEVRVKVGGGTAGHNGLKSVAQHLRTKEFVRVRVGISRPRGDRDPVGWVLEDFSAAERAELPRVLSDAADAVERTLSDGVERAMNEFNTRAR